MNIVPTDLANLNYPRRSLRPYGEQKKTALSPFDETLVSVPGSFTKKKDIESTAQQWVSQTFFGTLLKQMHESPFKSELWSGGRGGQAFSPLLDQHLAQRMARGSAKDLVKAIASKLEKTKSQTPTFGKPKPDAAPTQENPFDQVKFHVAPSFRT